MEIDVCGLKALVDECDFKQISKFRWNIFTKEIKHVYPFTIKTRLGVSRIISMHRMVVGKVPSGLVVDHVNGNTLDNRRANLEVVTVSENIRRGRRLDKKNRDEAFQRHLKDLMNGVDPKPLKKWINEESFKRLKKAYAKQPITSPKFLDFLARNNLTWKAWSEEVLDGKRSPFIYV